jgi:hypothetical protein
MLKVAAASTLAALSASAVGRAALGQEVIAESKGYKGDDCFDNRDCRRGLLCNQSSLTCQYKRSCGGKKGDACQGDGQCCRNRNLICGQDNRNRNRKNRNNDNNKCVRDNRPRN